MKRIDAIVTSAHRGAEPIPFIHTDQAGYHRRRDATVRLRPAVDPLGGIFGAGCKSIVCGGGRPLSAHGTRSCSRVARAAPGCRSGRATAWRRSPPASTCRAGAARADRSCAGWPTRWRGVAFVHCRLAASPHRRRLDDRSRHAGRPRARDCRRSSRCRPRIRGSGDDADSRRHGRGRQANRTRSERAAEGRLLRRDADGQPAAPHLAVR